MTDSSSTTRRQAIVILGMHRSGTSALAGLMMKLGGDGPATPLGANADNPRGHFESRALYLLQDALLASAGTSWDDYRPLARGWMTSPKADEFRHRLQTLLETEFGTSGFFIVKDPRNCRLVPVWRQVLAAMGVTPLFVHTHRDPMEVALSLQKRNGLDPEYGCLLWLRHVLDAEAASRGERRSFTSYRRLLQGWPAEVEKIADDLGISWPRYDSAQLPELAEMIRPDLRRNVSGDLSASRVFAGWFRETLAIMDRWAETGEDKTDHPALDRIRAGFDEASAVFGGAVHAKGKALSDERDAASKAADAAQAKGTKLQAGLEALTAERDALSVERDRVAAELDLSRNMLDQRKAEIDDTARDLDKARAALTQAEAGRQVLTERLAQASDRIVQLEAAAARRDRELVQVQKAVLRAQDDRRAEAERLADRAAEAKLLTERVRVLTDRLDRSEARVQALMASNSWRVTAPMRWIITKLRRRA